MANRELRKFRRELSEAAIVYSIAGAGIDSLQDSQERALAETDNAVRTALSAARSAGAGPYADDDLRSAVLHPDFRGEDNTEWLNFLKRLSPGSILPPRVQPATADVDAPPAPETEVVEAQASVSGRIPGGVSDRESAPLEPVIANPTGMGPGPVTVRDNPPDLGWLLWIPVVIALAFGGPWLINKVITRTSAEVGKCYDSQKAITATFDEVGCDRFDAFRLFEVGSTDGLQVSRRCPNHPLTVIVEWPDDSYCFAPAFLGG